MRISFHRTILASLVFMFMAVPDGVLAQEQGEPEAVQLPPEAQELIAELQEVQTGLETIQEQALQDPELQATQAALGEQIQLAMAESDPTVPERMDRLQVLIGEAQTAQAAQDEARLTEIVEEAREIDQGLQQAQAEAVQRPEIAPQVQSFQAKLEQKMVEVNPAADALLKRLRELDARLSAILSPGQ